MADTNENWLEGSHSYHSLLLCCRQENEVGALGEPSKNQTWRFSMAYIG
jgi:hypothetical protein